MLLPLERSSTDSCLGLAASEPECEMKAQTQSACTGIVVDED